MKKITIIILTFALYSILTSTTCNKGPYTWEIGEVGASFTGNTEQFQYTDSLSQITDDTIIMRLNIIPKYVSAINNKINFINEAYAFSRTERTLNHSISELTITSDHDFNGLSAGENLNDYIVFLVGAAYNQNDSIWQYYDTLSVQEYVYQNLVQGAYEYNAYNSTFMFKTRPTAKKQVFYFDFINSQGTHYFGKSDTLWID